MSDSIRTWSDADLAEALRRAWREAARCWSEARAAQTPILKKVLTETAESANEHYERLLAETRRREDERRARLIAEHGKCSHCSEPNAPGETMCAGHRRLMSYDSGAEYAANH